MNFNDFKNWSGVMGIRCDINGFRAETKLDDKEFISPYKPTEQEAIQALYDCCTNPQAYVHEPYVAPKEATKKTLITETVVEPVLTEKELVEKQLVLEPMTDAEFTELKTRLSTPIKEVVDPIVIDEVM